jgi:O-antigen/teichoic acid export membrane protein
MSLNIVFSLFVTPLVVRSLEKELYGIWSFLNGLLAYSDLLYLGLGSALIKFVAQYRLRGDLLALNRLVSVVFSVYIALGTLSLAGLTVLSQFVAQLFAEPLVGASARAAALTCVLLGVRVMLAFVSSVFAGVLCGQNRFALVNGVSIGSVTLRAAAIWYLLPGTSPLVTLASIITAIAVLEMLALSVIAWSTNPDLSMRPVTPQAYELRQLYKFGIQSFLLVFAIKLISYSDTTIIAMMLGATSVALYSLPLQLVEYVRIVIGGISGVFLPRLAVLVDSGDFMTLRRVYLSSIRIAGLVGAWLIGNVIALGVPFLTLWVGSDFGEPATYVLVFLCVAAWLHILSSQLPLPFYQALNLLATPARVLLIEASANVALSILLAPRFGIAGVAAATLLPALTVSFVILPRFLCRALTIGTWEWVYTAIIPSLALSIVLGLTHCALALIWPSTSGGWLVLKVLFSVPPCLTLAYIMLPCDERRLTSFASGLNPRHVPTAL